MPFRSEYRTYEAQEQAELDATLLADVLLIEVVVVEYASDLPVYYVGKASVV